jgi:antirestriction protein
MTQAFSKGSQSRSYTMNTSAANTTHNTSARIYVGTYAKHNQGSIKGAWLDLGDYADLEDFLAACRELHHDEADAEFMYQDWGGIPAGMITECHINETVWEWLELEQDDLDMVAAYRNEIDQSEDDIGRIRDAFQGVYDSQLDYVYEWVESTGMLDGLPEQVSRYFDFESFARDVFMGDVIGANHGGKLYVFSNY